MGREVAVLREGRLAQRAVPTALYRTPVNADVAQFVGEAVLSAGSAASGAVRCAFGELAVVSPGLEGPVEVMIRPEQIHLARRNGATGAYEGGVTAKVTDHAFYGPDTVVGLSLEGAAQIHVKARTFDHEIPAVGELVELVVIGPVVVFPRRAGLAGEVSVGDGTDPAIEDSKAREP